MSESIVVIPLTQGEDAVVNEADFHLVKDLTWCCSRDKSGVKYARSGLRIKMHRLIMGAKSGQVVDHRDGNGLNNRRSNLRLCSIAQNVRNRTVRKDSVSGFKGVCFLNRKTAPKWRAHITINRKRRLLGIFDSPEDAAKAYNDEAILHFGDFAKLNVLP